MSYNTTAGRNTIKWAKTGSATGYQIYRKAYGESSYTKIKSSTSLNYTDTTASSNTTYYYKVRAYYKKADGTCIYGDFSSVKSMLNGMNEVNGVWGYYINNVRQDSYTGMAKNQWGWWYFQNGTLNKTYTGLGTNEWGIWYYKNGQIAFSYTGTVTINKVKYNIVNGQVK